jgi:hypothetical protein
MSHSRDERGGKHSWHREFLRDSIFMTCRLSQVNWRRADAPIGPVVVRIFRQGRMTEGELIQLLGRVNREAMPDFPRIWLLIAFLLPGIVRTQTYDPAQEELKEDYLRARHLCSTLRERQWLTFCFTVRTAVLVVQSLCAWIGDRGLRFLQKIGLIGTAIHFLRNFFR